MPESTQGAAPLRVENDRGVRRLILDNPPVNIIDGTLIRELFKAVAVAAQCQPRLNARCCTDMWATRPSP